MTETIQVTTTAISTTGAKRDARPAQLTSRQRKFFRPIYTERLTPAQVIERQKLAPHTLDRWMGQMVFRNALVRAIEFLKLMRLADEAVASSTPNAPVAPAEGCNASQAVEVDPAVGLDAPPARKRDRAAPDDAPPPRITERERLRARFGERGVASYDRLARLQDGEDPDERWWGRGGRIWRGRWSRMGWWRVTLGCCGCGGESRRMSKANVKSQKWGGRGQGGLGDECVCRVSGGIERCGVHQAASDFGRGRRERRKIGGRGVRCGTGV